jgi:hypothetical protein
MAKKIPIIELGLIDPHLTKKRKFACVACNMTYTLKDYRTLYDSHKISYFQRASGSKIKYCHDCLEYLALKEKEKLGAEKIILKLYLTDDEVAVFNF